MNLPQFLRKVDENTNEMPKEQLEAFIHELARTLAEDKRSNFLKIMNEVNIKTDPSIMLRDNHAEELSDEIKEVTVLLKSINNGERCLDSEYNTLWDEWYDSDDEDILFSDPEDLLSDIEKAIDLVHKCKDMEEYSLGCGLAEILSVMEVSATGEYNEYDGSPLGINELYEKELLNGSFENLVRESLYLVYMGNKLSDRAEELYCMMDNYQCFEVKLEEIMQEGSHALPDFDKFLPLWISCLGDHTEYGTETLLQEACAMIEDDEQLLNTARKFSDKHPELYKQLLESGFSGKNERLVQIGREALEKIPQSLVIRSEIALLTAEYARRIKEDDCSEDCWLEAFRSKTSVVNYMRIRLMAKDWSRYEAQVKQIYEEVYERTKTQGRGYRTWSENQAVNTLDNKAYCAILFFEEAFDKVIELGMSEKRALGWSLTFMKEGLALFLLLLFKGEALQQGLNAMLLRAVSVCNFCTEEYLKGTCTKESENDRELFWKLFYKWKNYVSVSEEKAGYWMEKIEQLIAVRTEGIMDANRRNYYGECASFIAAYGEVKESWGIKNAKAAVMKSYKEKYSRRRAFHQELRDVGMRW